MRPRAATHDLPPMEIRSAFVNDFRTAWNAVARTRTAPGRGNFMFALAAATYLEWAATLATQDTTIARAFADGLDHVEPRYFSELPVARREKVPTWFPRRNGSTGDPILWAVFDLVRNGLGHKYQQSDAELSDGSRLRIQLTGAEHPAYPRSRPFLNKRKRLDHMNAIAIAPRGQTPTFIVLRVHPDVLFADIDDAVDAASGLLALPPIGWTKKYATTHESLAVALGVKTSVGGRP